MAHNPVLSPDVRRMLLQLEDEDRSQREIAERFGVTTSTISRWLRDAHEIETARTDALIESDRA